MTLHRNLAVVLGVALASGSSSLAQHDHVIQNESEAKWVDAPPFVPAGSKISVVYGNPMEKGPYAMRVKFPAGYKIPAHWHPSDEHVVVLSGVLYMGMGDKLDTAAGTALKVGGFALMPARKHHFAFAKEETTILLFGEGPVDFTYVNPADDPRRAPKK